jgi:hypothetical protein
MKQRAKKKRGPWDDRQVTPRRSKRLEKEFQHALLGGGEELFGVYPTLGEADQRALAILRERGPLPCSQLGEALWGRRGAGNCSCPWARPAGRLLHRLLKLGLVHRTHDAHFTLWSAA